MSPQEAEEPGSPTGVTGEGREKEKTRPVFPGRVLGWGPLPSALDFLQMPLCPSPLRSLPSRSLQLCSAKGSPAEGQRAREAREAPGPRSQPLPAGLPWAGCVPHQSHGSSVGSIQHPSLLTGPADNLQAVAFCPL